MSLYRHAALAFRALRVAHALRVPAG